MTYDLVSQVSRTTPSQRVYFPPHLPHTAADQKGGGLLVTPAGGPHSCIQVLWAQEVQPSEQIHCSLLLTIRITGQVLIPRQYLLSSDTRLLGLVPLAGRGWEDMIYQAASHKTGVSYRAEVQTLSNTDRQLTLCPFSWPARPHLHV